MSLPLTGERRTIYKILSELPDEDLFNLCLSNKSMNTLCNRDEFWKDRLFQHFGLHALRDKPENQSWKQHYLEIVYDINKYNEGKVDQFGGDYARAYLWQFIAGHYRVSLSELIENNQIYVEENDEIFKLKDTSPLVQHIHNYGYLAGLQITLIHNKYYILEDEVKTYSLKKNNQYPAYFTPRAVFELIRNYYLEIVDTEDLEKFQKSIRLFLEDNGLKEGNLFNNKKEYTRSDLISIRKKLIGGKYNFFQVYTYNKDDLGDIGLLNEDNTAYYFRF